tara:strand:+ start:914 stop:1600 length:687 start_codon:yes stop_codon:yes gene_type:complete
MSDLESRDAPSADTHGAFADRIRQLLEALADMEARRKDLAEQRQADRKAAEYKLQHASSQARVLWLDLEIARKRMPLQDHGDLEIECHEAQESFEAVAHDFNFEETRWNEHLMDQSKAADIQRKLRGCADLAFGASPSAWAFRHDHGLDAVSASRIAADVATEAAEEALRLYDRASGHWPTSDALLTHVERQAINAVDDAADLAVVARMAEATEAAAVSSEMETGHFV